jgi:RNA polymerase sigma factor (sigma-70 family)
MCAVRADIVRRPFGSSSNQAGTERSRLQSVRFEVLFVTNRVDILKYLIRRSRDIDEAADALAETFLVAWRRIDAVPDGLEGRLWLFGVARNVLSKQFKKRQLTTAINQRLATELRFALSYSTGDWEESMVHRALAQLSKSDREIVELSAWEELSPAEIASILGISANAARVRLHRARQRVADVLLRTELISGE